ncbi:MAG: hypothetical protein ABW047_03200 [Nitrospiraceae bacterium]
MAQGKYERHIRVLHRWIGMSALVFLLLSVTTGLLWANAKFLYWNDHYKDKVRPFAERPLETAKLTVTDAIRLGSVALATPAHLEQISLRSDFGRLVYNLRIREGKSAKVLLIDADTGEWLSPVNLDMAVKIAGQYVRENADVTAVTTEQYTPRNKHQAVDAIRVSYNDRDKTQIILDRQSGEILEDEGRWRRFHFFVMRLHQLNFFGFEKTLLNIPGFPLLLIGVTGLALGVLHIVRKGRSRLVTDAQTRAIHSRKEDKTQLSYPSGS